MINEKAEEAILRVADITGVIVATLCIVFSLQAVEGYYLWFAFYGLGVHILTNKINRALRGE